jgi:hypothetical protein
MRSTMLPVRYAKAFPNDPLPKVYWQSSEEQLDRLMEAAIKVGRPLTAADLCKAQGLEMPPPGAIV